MVLWPKYLRITARKQVVSISLHKWNWRRPVRELPSNTINLFTVYMCITNNQIISVYMWHFNWYLDWTYSGSGLTTANHLKTGLQLNSRVYDFIYKSRLFSKKRSLLKGRATWYIKEGKLSVIGWFSQGSDSLHPLRLYDSSWNLHKSVEWMTFLFLKQLFQRKLYLHNKERKRVKCLAFCKYLMGFNASLVI